MSKGLSSYQQAILQRVRERGSINIVEVCNLVLTVRGLKKDPSFKPSQVFGVRSNLLRNLAAMLKECIEWCAHLKKRGLVARLLHRRPAVWYDFSWHGETPKLEQRSHGWYDHNHVTYRDGQVSFQIKDKRWIIRGVKMSDAQIKRQIDQQISEMKKREQAN